MFRIKTKFFRPYLNSLSVSTVMLGTLLSGFLFSMPATAENLGNKQVTVDSSPQLIRAAVATYPGVNALAQYQFTVRVPENARKPLEAVKITQKENLEQIRFNLSQSDAFAGSRFAGGPAVSIARIGGSEASDTNEITVAFDPPIQPGSTVTISLRGTHPTWGGIYLFGVTAFPIGENSLDSYLGVGRIAFP